MDTLAERGWSDKSNGELLVLAEQAGYKIFVTTDQNLRYQQNLETWKIGFVVLLSTNWNELQHYTKEIHHAVASVQTEEIVEVPLRLS